MSFDEIPENAKERHPCPEKDCAGSVSLSEDGYWECDTCDFCVESDSLLNK